MLNDARFAPSCTFFNIAPSNAAFLRGKKYASFLRVAGQESRNGLKFQAAVKNFAPSANLIRTKGSLITLIKTNKIRNVIS